MRKGTKRASAAIGLLAATAVLLVAFAAPARGADSIYWVNLAASSISHADQAGGGGTDVPIGAGVVNGPYGLAIDAATGRLFWANFDGDSIGFANLDGSGGGTLNTAGTAVSKPAGVAIDPAAGRIYWANSAANTISFANLDGSGGGALNTGAATVKGPFGVAIDPASGRVYWANYEANSISFANLDGSGGGDLNITGATINGPDGVAIDQQAGRIYWANFDTSTIGFASLSGGGGGQLDTTGAVVEEPAGLAIDPAANRIYWGNGTANTLGVASLSGGGQGQVDTTGATVDHVAYPVLLHAPRGTQPPSVTAKAMPQPREATASRAPARALPSHAAVLSCSQGGWSGDLLGSFLFQAPRAFSYQWLRNGEPIPGATTNQLAASLVGSYACSVTASNFAGTAAQASAPFAIAAKFKLGQLRRNARTGTATLSVMASGLGKVLLRGRKLVGKRGQIRFSRGRLTPRRPSQFAAALRVQAKGKARKKLNETGRVKVKARIAYTPEGSSEPLVRRRTIVLRKQLP